jgi:hypothetical protein
MNLNHNRLMSVGNSYRDLATEARQAADSKLPDRYRDAYRRMARHWAQLASEVEECLGWPEDTLH